MLQLNNIYFVIDQFLNPSVELVFYLKHKGQGGYELKSFDEMERMTSELEDTSAPENQDDKSSGEPLGMCK